jgi:hypothetical protein
MPYYRQARRRRFGPPWRRRMILLPMTLIGLRTPPHQSCRGYSAGRYVKSLHLFGWRVCLALPGYHLHVVHGVSTPYEEARTVPFVHNENSIYDLQRTQPGWSRRSAGDAPTERTSRRWRCFRARMTVKSVAEFSESWVLRLAKGGMR